MPSPNAGLEARRVNQYVDVTEKDQGRSTISGLEAQLLGGSNNNRDQSSGAVLSSDVGLPMMRQIVQMHGGRIWFETGAGTESHFTLPISGTVHALAV